ncbi:MAG TPA: aldo/keto reductase [Actinomycetota bacterium]|nr:aldo/keto reductase [Actinomycetota bacterium]
MLPRALGDRAVFPIGLGCLPLSDPRMLAHRDRALQTIHTALDAGVDLLDTADIYAPDGKHFGHNEELVAEALRCYPGPRPLVATKGGITRAPGEVWGRSGSPAALLAAAEASAGRLGVDSIDLYYLHRADPSVHFAQQIAGLVGVQQRGLARRIGLSNVDSQMLQYALDIAGGPADGGIVAVQNERSPRYRADGDVLDMCAAEGIAYLPWSPLTGAEVFASAASAHAVSPQRLTLAWLLAQSPVVIPIPGSSRPATVLDCVAAVHLTLPATEVERLSAIPVEQASRYPDSEPRPPL